MVERINNTVKWCAVGLADNELLHGKTFSSIRQVTDAVRKAVKFYNEERPHSSINMLTPNQAHQMEGELKKPKALALDQSKPFSVAAVATDFMDVTAGD